MKSEGGGGANGWTVTTLREHFDKVIVATQELAKVKYESQQEAVARAREILDERTNINDKWKNNIESEIRNLRDSEKFIAGKASQNSVYIAWGLALLAIVIEAINMSK